MSKIKNLSYLVLGNSLLSDNSDMITAKVQERPEVLNYVNLDLVNLVTPVDADKLEELLSQTNYDPIKSKHVVKGFRQGFSLGYMGKKHVKLTSPNLKLRVGLETELWNKMMKEVKEKRFAGPFDAIPFEYYIQSPVGLVPKDQGLNTRLIFHLSYPRKFEASTGPISVNANTPKNKCKVHYPDLDLAIKRCLEEGKNCFCGKSDAKAAFRNLPISSKYWKFLIMKARDLISKNWKFMVDKCLPFRSSISCTQFQAVSNAISHIVKVKSNNKINVNYLDDYIFISILKILCNGQVEMFLKICSEINFPVALEKTFWATQLITFLSFLIDTVNQIIGIPKEKVLHAVTMIESVMSNKNNKVTVLEIQKLCGFLNFLCRCIVPGTAFLTRLYALLPGGRNTTLKQHHHVQLTMETKLDLKIWLLFLNSGSAFYRPFIDFTNSRCAVELDWYTNAAKNVGKSGAGGHHGTQWFFYRWPQNFLLQKNPSIAFLELFALTVGVLLWLPQHRNARLVLFCDNESVCKMVSKQSSKCKNCMALIRLLVLQQLIYNTRVFAKHVRTELNGRADSISRMKFQHFIALRELQ